MGAWKHFFYGEFVITMASLFKATIWKPAETNFAMERL
jgi:hypothetical protein